MKKNLAGGRKPISDFGKVYKKSTIHYRNILLLLTWIDNFVFLSKGHPLTDSLVKGNFESPQHIAVESG